MRLLCVSRQHREALILLKDVVRHLNAATQAELTPKAYNLMGALIENVVYGAEDHYEFFTKLIPSGEFLVRPVGTRSPFSFIHPLTHSYACGSLV